MQKAPDCNAVTIAGQGRKHKWQAEGGAEAATLREERVAALFTRNPKEEEGAAQQGGDGLREEVEATAPSTGAGRRRAPPN